MAKKLKLNDALVSLYGISFEEALSGVLAAKPPGEKKEGEKEDGREKKTPAAPKDEANECA